MINPTQFIDMVGTAFFGGSSEIAGLVFYVVIMAVMFAITKNVFQTLIIALPVTFIFSGAGLGILPADMVLLLIVVVVLGLAMTSKKVLTR